MRDINQHIILRPRREAIAIHPSVSRGGQFDTDTLSRRGLVVAHGARVCSGARDGDIGKGITDIANQRELRDGSIFRRTASALLVHHAEPREITSGQIPRIRICALVVQVRTELDHPEWSRRTGEVVAHGVGPHTGSRVSHISPGERKKKNQKQNQTQATHNISTY